MAHIPYGYKIEKGQAVIDETEGKQVQALFEGYINGISLNALKDLTGIPRSRAALTHMLGWKVYLGDDYYPRLIDDNTFHKVQEEHQSRLLLQPHKGTKKMVKALPIRSAFTLDIQAIDTNINNPAKAISELYKHIDVSDDGKTGLSFNDRLFIRHWLHIEH